MSKKTEPVTIQVPARMWTIILVAVLGIGGAGGSIGLVKSVTAENVSKQISTESPYLEDRKLIMQGLADSVRKDMMMFDKIDAVENAIGEARTEQRLMKQSIDQIKAVVVKN